ncbi:MAG: hypothetical protein M0Q12_07790 [Synergistaceae bacterium]|jgi:hypothetical protein|nr:hypothetical protein [Synergistaceae bacterium]MDD2261698.1 hypothetical protein [Clostridia bacterium]MDD3971338.1 hypothetical protein [Clostridia bacterium]
MKAIAPKFEQKFKQTQSHSSETKKNTTSVKTTKSHKEMVDAEIQYLLQWAYNNYK